MLREKQMIIYMRILMDWNVTFAFFIVQSAWNKCVCRRLNVSIFMLDLKNGGGDCYQVL
jgi:hypothetical protein